MTRMTTISDKEVSVDGIGKIIVHVPHFQAREIQENADQLAFFDTFFEKYRLGSYYGSFSIGEIKEIADSLTKWVNEKKLAEPTCEGCDENGKCFSNPKTCDKHSQNTSSFICPKCKKRYTTSAGCHDQSIYHVCKECQLKDIDDLTGIPIETLLQDENDDSDIWNAEIPPRNDGDEA
jgi:hypothetical protein